MRKGNDTFFYHYNAHGDVIALTNQQGEVVARYEYDAWGNPLKVEENSSVTDNPFRYAGYQYDKETGMYYLIARYYHPEQGVFLSLDPDPGDDDDILSQNGYTYVNNNPVMLVDPDGHLFWVVVNGGFAIYDSYKAYKAGKGFWGILGAGAAGLIGAGKLKSGYKLVKTVKGVKTVKATSKAKKGFSKVTFKNNLYKDYERHVFSKKHVKEGIMKLGKDRKSIFRSITSKIASVNPSKIKKGSNQIYTKINGYNVTIRFYVDDRGIVISVNAFMGRANKVIGNLIK